MMAASDQFPIVVADRLHVFDPANNTVASVPFADISGEEPASDSPLRAPAILTAHEIVVGERRTIVFWPSAHSKASPRQREQAASAFSQLGEFITLESDGPGVAKASSSMPKLAAVAVAALKVVCGWDETEVLSITVGDTTSSASP